MSSPKTYPRSKVFSLLTELGHDPTGVSQIVIDPRSITVEYIHPLSGSGYESEDHPLEDR